jgi:alkylhydroperoxidase family enzyme
VGRESGLDENDLRNLAEHREHSNFSETESLVLRFAECLTETPADVEDELYEMVIERLSEREIVELTALVSWENYRARFNRAFDLQAQGFSDGTACPLPEHESRTDENPK